MQVADNNPIGVGFTASAPADFDVPGMSAPAWSDTKEYIHRDVVTGRDGKIYICCGADNGVCRDRDPTNSRYWRPLTITYAVNMGPSGGRNFGSGESLTLSGPGANFTANAANQHAINTTHTVTLPAHGCRLHVQPSDGFVGTYQVFVREYHGHR